MARHAAATNAPAHPWRRVLRTLFAVVPAFAALAPVIYEQATQHDPATAGGAAFVALSIAGAITRVLGDRRVETFLRRFAPWLSAGDVAAEQVVALAVPAPVGTDLDVVAGPAHPAPTGTPVIVPPLVTPPD